MKTLSRTTARRSGKKPGKNVEEYLKEQLAQRSAYLRVELLKVMDSAPKGVLCSDVIDSTLAALIEFADCDIIVDRILEKESLVFNLHERMTSNI